MVTEGIAVSRVLAFPIFGGFLLSGLLVKDFESILSATRSTLERACLGPEKSLKIELIGEPAS